ncbi:MAG: hypothetical protein KAJ55_03085 [Anaerolineales bacterium]|nr:hypothetical protein [Anaerolineales bacterium]
MKSDLENIGLWIAAPTVRLTENCKKKWVRVVGVLLMFPLFPLIPIGLSVIGVWMAIEMYKEI